MELFIKSLATWRSLAGPCACLEPSFVEVSSRSSDLSGASRFELRDFGAEEVYILAWLSFPI